MISLTLYLVYAVTLDNILKWTGIADDWQGYDGLWFTFIMVLVTVGWGKNEIEDKACGIDDRYDSYNVPSATQDCEYFSIEGRKI